jgi:hypothetical protein
LWPPSLLEIADFAFHNLHGNLLSVDEIVAFFGEEILPTDFNFRPVALRIAITDEKNIHFCFKGHFFAWY